MRIGDGWGGEVSFDDMTRIESCNGTLASYDLWITRCIDCMTGSKIVYSSCKHIGSDSQCDYESMLGDASDRDKYKIMKKGLNEDHERQTRSME